MKIVKLNLQSRIAFFDLTTFFSEISYLQLTTLDLSGNRIATLPVELRFMTTVMCLNLGENPLTCPPANVS